MVICSLQGFSTVYNLYTCHLRTVYLQSTNTRRRWSQLVRRWLEGESGRFTRRVDTLLQACSCVLRVAPIMEKDSSFVELPVLADDKIQFTDTRRDVEGGEEINRGVTAVKSSVKMKHIEGEISEAPISELGSRRTSKCWENSLQDPPFRKISRARLKLGDCLQTGCTPSTSEVFKLGGEGYSSNSLLRDAEDGLVDVANTFSELRDVWDKDADKEH